MSEMNRFQDPTSYQAIDNYYASKYRKPDEEYKTEQPPLVQTLGNKVLRAMGIVVNTETEKFVSPYTNIISLNNSDIIRIRKLKFSDRFPDSDKIEIKSINDNIVRTNIKIPRGVLVSITYDYKVPED
jgi:hypothetical protein